MNEARPSIGHAPAAHAPAGHGHSSLSTAGGNANPSPYIPTPVRAIPIPNPSPAHGPSQHAPNAASKPVVEEEPLELEEERPAADAPKSKIHGITGTTGLSGHLAQQTFKRGLHSNQTGAVRMRTFHCRLSEQGVEYLDQAINGWLDQHPEIEVKFTTSVIGMWDGKLKEPALIINVWY